MQIQITTIIALCNKFLAFFIAAANTVLRQTKGNNMNYQELLDKAEANGLVLIPTPPKFEKVRLYSIAGCNKTREVEQDIYRLCFKNNVTDEMSDNDMQDLTSILCVVSAALNLDAVRKVTSGIVEIPAAQSKP